MKDDSNDPAGESTTESTPVTPGQSRDTVAAGGATVPRGEQVRRGHASTQPLAPDGSPMPIDEDHHLTVEPDDEDAG